MRKSPYGGRRVKLMVVSYGAVVRARTSGGGCIYDKVKTTKYRDGRIGSRNSLQPVGTIKYGKNTAKPGL